MQMVHVVMGSLQCLWLKVVVAFSRHILVCNLHNIASRILHLGGYKRGDYV